MQNPLKKNMLQTEFLSERYVLRIKYILRDISEWNIHELTLQMYFKSIFRFCFKKIILKSHQL